MNTLTAVCFIATMIVSSMMAYTLSFEDTTFGGYLPFLFLGFFAPVAGFVLGKIESI